MGDEDRERVERNTRRERERQKLYAETGRAQINAKNEYIHHCLGRRGINGYASYCPFAGTTTYRRYPLIKTKANKEGHIDPQHSKINSFEHKQCYCQNCT